MDRARLGYLNRHPQDTGLSYATATLWSKGKDERLGSLGDTHARPCKRGDLPSTMYRIVWSKHEWDKQEEWLVL